MSESIVAKNEALVIPELNGAKIRKTKDGHFSVYDLIRLCTGIKNPREFWLGKHRTKKDGNATTEGLVGRYPEVVDIVYNYKFEGKGQKETPVATLENCLYILGLLPGECGKSYREKAAALVRRYIEGDSDLAVELLYRDHNKERVERAMRRLQVVDTNKSAAAVVHNTNHSVALMHDDRYRGLYSKNTRQLRKECGATERETPLNYMSERDLAYNYAVNLMVIESGDPNKAFEGGRGMADLHKRVTGKDLSPVFKESCLPPHKARKTIDKGQLELPC